MRIIKLLIIVLALVVTAGTATAQASVTSEITQEEFEAGETHHIATFQLQNGNNNTSMVLSNTAIDTENLITWDFQFTPSTAEIANNSTQGIRLNATIPENFQAGDFDAEATFGLENEIDQVSQLDITVAESKTWNITNSSIKDNVSVSTEGNIGQYTLENTGNSDVRVNQTINGEISEYISVADTVTLFPKIPQTRTLAYDIPEDTDFGNYTGNLTISSSENNISKTLNLSVEVLDDISPKVDSKSFESFEATQGHPFTVEASDNLEVESVEAKILYESSTVNGTENQTLEVLNFEKNNQTESWRANMTNETRVDEYFVIGNVTDTAGNSENFTDSFSINTLQSFSPEEIIELPRYKEAEEVTKHLSELQTSTEIGITLDSIKGNFSDYQIGLEVQKNSSEDAERIFFDEIGDTITLNEKSNVSLVVYSEESQRFNGQLSFDTPRYHKEIPPSRFEGEFTDFVTPKDTKFTVSGIKYDCEGEPSSYAENSTWDCNFKVSAEDVGEIDNLEEAVDIVVPEEAREEQASRYEDRIDEMESSLQTANLITSFSVFGGFLLLITTVYITRYHPSHYSINRERSRSEKVQVGKTVKEKLGIGE